MDNDITKIGFIIITFIVGLVLAILPLPHALVFLRPHWVLLVLMYWLINVPQLVGVKMAFFIGILHDLLVGSLLGSHALIYVVFAFCVTRLRALLYKLPLWQQMLVVGVFVLIDYVANQWFYILSGGLSVSWWAGLSIGVSMLFWPWVAFVLMQCQRRFIMDFYYQ